MNGSIEAQPAADAVRPAPIRLFFAALLAGVICNVSGIALGILFLHDEAAAVFSKLSRPPSPMAIFVQHVSMRLLIGVLVAWLFVALSSSGRGAVRSALTAALFVWLSSYALAGMMLHELEIYSTFTTAIALIWGLAELCLMSLAVAWVLRRRPGSDSTA